MDFPSEVLLLMHNNENCVTEDYIFLSFPKPGYPNAELTESSESKVVRLSQRLRLKLKDYLLYNSPFKIGQWTN